MAGRVGGETVREAPRRPQGGVRDTPGRRQGGNGALVAPPYEVRSTTNEVPEALTRRWAVGPANCLQTRLDRVLADACAARIPPAFPVLNMMGVGGRSER